MSLRSIVRAILRQNASQQISKERMWVKKRAFCLYETHRNKYVISCIVWTSNSKTIFHNKCHRWRVDESTILVNDQAKWWEHSTVCLCCNVIYLIRTVHDFCPRANAHAPNRASNRSIVHRSFTTLWIVDE